MLAHRDPTLCIYMDATKNTMGSPLDPVWKETSINARFPPHSSCYHIFSGASTILLVNITSSSILSFHC